MSYFFKILVYIKHLFLGLKSHRTDNHNYLYCDNLDFWKGQLDYFQSVSLGIISSVKCVIIFCNHRWVKVNEMSDFVAASDGGNHRDD